MEVTAELGEPDCKLIEPFVIETDDVLSPWMIGLTNDNQFMISSDKILSLTEPTPALVKKYKSLLD